MSLTDVSLSVILPPVVCPPPSAPSRQPSKGPADPGALVFRRLKPALAQERMGVLVPAAVRKVVAKHGGGRLRLAHHAERHIDLCQPQQRLLDVPRRLILGHDLLEAGGRASVVAPLLVVAPDQHLLPGKLIAALSD